MKPHYEVACDMKNESNLNEKFLGDFLFLVLVTEKLVTKLSRCFL